MCVLSDKEDLLQESWLMFVFHMGPELDVSLDAGKLAGLIKGHGVGAVEYVIPGLQRGGGRSTGRKRG